MNRGASTIATVLARAERDLLQLLSEAASRADYRTIDAARAAAQGIRALAASIETGPARHHADPELRRPDGSRRTRSSSRRGSRLPADYPRFSISNDRLYKIGWSKKRKREYVHKLSKSTLDRVIQAMCSISTGGAGPCTAQQIIEQATKHASAPLPDYQVYVVLAWLKAAGLVQQVGRDGYTFETSLREQVQSRWEALASRAA